jgi:hypothetical protein
MKNIVSSLLHLLLSVLEQLKKRGEYAEHAGRVVNKTKSTKHEQNKSNIYLQSHSIKLA